MSDFTDPRQHSEPIPAPVVTAAAAPVAEHIARWSSDGRRTTAETLQGEDDARLHTSGEASKSSNEYHFKILTLVDTLSLLPKLWRIRSFHLLDERPWLWTPLVCCC